MMKFIPPLCVTIFLALMSTTEQAVLVDTATCDVPDNSLEWDSNPEQVRFDVHWSYDEEALCNSKQTCNLTEINSNTTENYENRMRIQLKPVELQPGNKLWFHLGPIADTPFPKVFKVDEDAFLNCDAIGWLPIVMDTQTEQSFEVSEQLLRPGNNYFIVENEGVVQCDMGLRLNVTVKTDLCPTNVTGPVCNGRGRCVTSKGQAAYSCHCCGNYKGSQCHVYDVCLSNPCFHGGECLGLISNDTDSNSTRDITDYQCKCSLGFYGERCENQYQNMCEAVKCLNGANCTGNATHSQCQCRPGYIGSLCDLDYSECHSSPCRHGYCIDRVNGFDCQCFPGFYGSRCEFKHPRCMPNPCRHDGVGVNLTVSDQFQWECHCHSMWKGKACDERAAPCETNPCSPHGVCVEGELDYFCQCEPGFTGHFCEVNINDCDPNPCHNHGICRDLANDYSCLCLNAHAGRNCEYTINIFNPVLDDIDAIDRATRLSEENRNLYIMAGALTAGLIIVVTVLLICYCRRHEDIREFCGIRIPYLKRTHSTSDDLTVSVDARNSLDCPLTSDSFFKDDPGCGPVTNPAFESQVV